jgi:hypothetical protein
MYAIATIVAGRLPDSLGLKTPLQTSREALGDTPGRGRWWLRDLVVDLVPAVFFDRDWTHGRWVDLAAL